MADLSDPLITPELLDTFRSQEDLPEDVWYLVVATCLTVLNRPEEIPAVYKHAVGLGHSRQGLQNGAPLTDQEQLRIARRLREALLKTSAIGGMPKVSPKSIRPPDTRNRPFYQQPPLPPLYRPPPHCATD